MYVSVYIYIYYIHVFQVMESAGPQFIPAPPSGALEGEHADELHGPSDSQNDQIQHPTWDSEGCVILVERTNYVWLYMNYRLYRYHPIMFWGCQHGRHDSTCKIWLFYFSWDLHYLELDNPINQSKCSPSTLTNTIIWKSIECPPSQISRGCECQGWPHSIYFRMGRFT